MVIRRGIVDSLLLFSLFGSGCLASRKGAQTTKQDLSMPAEAETGAELVVVETAVDTAQEASPSDTTQDTGGEMLVEASADAGCEPVPDFSRVGQQCQEWGRAVCDPAHPDDPLIACYDGKWRQPPDPALPDWCWCNPNNCDWDAFVCGVGFVGIAHAGLPRPRGTPVRKTVVG